jgi:hypothetical protein
MRCAGLVGGGPLTSGKGTTRWRGAGDKGRSVSSTGASARTRSGTGHAPGSGAVSCPRCSTVSGSGSRCQPRPRARPGQAGRAAPGRPLLGTYTVRQCVEDWLTHGLDGRSDKTRQTYREAVAPLLAVLGSRTLRDLTATDVRRALVSIAKTRSTRSVQIAHNTLTRAVQRAAAHDLVARNVAASGTSLGPCKP